MIRAPASIRVVVAGWLAAAMLLVSGVATAYQPPAMDGHVTDLADKLTTAEEQRLEQRMDRVRRSTGRELAVLIVPTLDGASIEDVAYETFNSWRLGREQEDDGVLVVIAPVERQVRIETGKGIGGDLTDLQANDIIRRRMSPLLREDRFGDAIDAGVTGIAEALGIEEGPGTTEPRTPPESRDRPGGMLSWLLPIIVFLLFWRFRRHGGFFIFPGGFGGGGFGGGGGGFFGGGGASGGGGSSDRY